MDLLKATFTASNTIRSDKRPHTIYEIEIRSSSTITWVIWRRYRQFFALHQSLVTELGGSKIQLPKVPPKRITGSLGTAFVEKRKKELQRYLTLLLQIPEVVRSEAMMEFLDVPDAVRPMILPKIKGIKEDMEEEKSPLGAINKRNLSRDERKIYELVTQLDHHQQAKVAAIKSFEKYYFESTPRVSSDYIDVLYQGIEGRGGLVETCGNFEYSNVAARAALELLCRLLDIERNQNAPAYLDVFFKQDPKIFTRLNLHRHILSDRNGGAFKLASIIYEKMPHLPIAKLISDPAARRDFIRWLQRKNQAMTPYIPDSKENFMKSPTMQDVEYKSLVDNAFEEVINISKSNQGWRLVVDESGTNIQVVYKTVISSDTVVLRVGMEIMAPADEVFELLMNEEMRGSWDVKFHEGRIVKQLGNNVEIVHEVFKSFSSPYKHRDFSLLRSFHEEEDGSRVITMTSIVHPEIPEYKDNVRANLMSTGYLITPYQVENEDGVSIDATLLLWIAQLDREAVLIFSPDLLGETDELFRSFQNLRSILTGDEDFILDEEEKY